MWKDSQCRNKRVRYFVHHISDDKQDDCKHDDGKQDDGKQDDGKQDAYTEWLLTSQILLHILIHPKRPRLTTLTNLLLTRLFMTNPDKS